MLGKAVNGFNMNGRGWKSAQALPEIIAELRRKGFEPVTVGEMIRGGRGAAGDGARHG
jgi:hypothetical protein